MIVYVLADSKEYGTTVYGVFTSLKKAERAMSNKKVKSEYGEFLIFERELDKTSSKEPEMYL